jgi:hypothetical protein
VAARKRIILKTQDLIDSLVTNLVQVLPGKMRRDMLLGAGTGAAVALGMVLLMYGLRPNILCMAHAKPLLLKASYGFALAAIAAAILLPMAKATEPPPHLLKLPALPILALAFVALIQMNMSPTGAAEKLWLGTARPYVGTFRIVTMSLPLLAGLCWALRRQAPLQLAAAGAAAGLLAGGLAASFYALSCKEQGAGFVLVFYSAGIAISTAIGALIGPRILRW